MKRSIIITFLLLTLLLPVKVNAVDSDIVKLSSCVDSESARFIRGVLEVKIKFIGIQLEEKIIDTKEDEINNSLVSDYVCSLLENAKSLKIEYEPSLKDEDKFGRTPAWVFVDDVLLQEDLIKNGYARAMYIEDNYKYASNLKEAQAYAKENELGIWMNQSQEAEEPVAEEKEESKGIIEIIIDFFVSIFRKIKEFVDSIIDNIL